MIPVVSSKKSSRKSRGRKSEPEPEAEPEPAAPAAPAANPDEPSAAEICENFGLNDVDLEYGEAEFQNLTSYKLFQQTFKARIQSGNPKVSLSPLEMSFGYFERGLMKCQSFLSKIRGKNQNNKSGYLMKDLTMK